MPSKDLVALPFNLDDLRKRNCPAPEFIMLSNLTLIKRLTIDGMRTVYQAPERPKNQIS